MKLPWGPLDCVHCEVADLNELFCVFGAETFSEAARPAPIFSLKTTSLPACVRTAGFESIDRVIGVSMISIVGSESASKLYGF